MIGNVSGLWMLKVTTVILNDEIIGKGPIEINNPYTTGDAVVSISKLNLDTFEVNVIAAFDNCKVIDGAPGAPDAEKTYSSKGLRLTASYFRGPLTYVDNDGEAHEFYFDITNGSIGYILYNNVLYCGTDL